MTTKILYIALALMSLSAFSQQTNPKITLTGTNNQATIYRGGLGANGALWLPTHDEDIFTDIPMKGRVRFTDKLQVHDGTNWVDVGGGLGGVTSRFGIEDTSTSQDRAVNLEHHNMQFENVGEFNLTGGLSTLSIPYDEELMYFEQTNTLEETALYGKSLLYIDGIPIEGGEIEAYFTIDGSPKVVVFNLYSSWYGPVWVTDEIQGTEISLLYINTQVDESSSTFKLSHFKITGRQFSKFEHYDGEQLGFSQTNPFSDIHAWDGKSLVNASYPYANEESEYPDTVMVKISVDGVVSDMIFTKDTQYSESYGYNIIRWIRPEIIGNEAYTTGLIKVITAPANVTLALPRTGYEGQDIVVKGSDGALKYATLDMSTPNLDAVAQQGSTINYRDVKIAGNYGEINLFTMGTGPYYANMVVSGVNQAWPAVEYGSRYIKFKDYDSSINIQAPYSTGGMIRTVTLPNIDGTIPVKSELSNLIERTIVTTASSLDQSALNNLITPADTSTGNFMASLSNIIYSGTANATWEISPTSTGNLSQRYYNIYNNSDYTITVQRVGLTTFWVNGVSSTSITIPARKSVKLLPSNENRYYIEGTVTANVDMKRGSTTFTLDGTTKVFNIPHGLAIIPASMALTFSDGSNTQFIQSIRSKDATNITITCNNAPTAGTITVDWQVYR